MKTNLLLSAALCLCFAGCSNSGNQTVPEPPSQTGETDAAASAHQHPEQGPHEGELIELGKEDYHAEMVHSDEGISIYLLDSAATKTVATASEKLILGLKKEEAVKSFDLIAKPGPSDPEGQSSHFSSADPELHEWLDEGAEGSITIEIDGKSFTGNVSHDHEGHDH